MKIRSVVNQNQSLYILTDDLDLVEFKIQQNLDSDGYLDSLNINKRQNLSDIMNSDHTFNSNYELLYDSNSNKNIYIFTKKKLYLKGQNSIQDVSGNNLIIRHQTQKSFIYMDILLTANRKEGIDIYSVSKNCEYQNTLSKQELMFGQQDQMDIYDIHLDQKGYLYVLCRV